MVSSSVSLSSSVSSYTSKEDEKTLRSESKDLPNFLKLNFDKNHLRHSNGVFTAYFKRAGSQNKPLSSHDTMARLTEPHPGSSSINLGLKSSPYLIGMSAISDTIDSKHKEEDDFYEEIDQRMSRGSCEYPEQQAKFVNRWLDDMDLSNSKSPETSGEWGNIIGIRGISNGRKSKRTHYRRDSRGRKVKSEYLKLRNENAKLKDQVNRLVQKFKRISKSNFDSDTSNDNQIQGKGPRNRKSMTQIPQCNCENKVDQTQTSMKEILYEKDDELNKLREKITELNAKISLNDQEYLEKFNQLKLDYDNFKTNSETTKTKLELEISNLKENVVSLSHDPVNRLAMALKKENSRLKDMKAIDNIEFEALKEYYMQLEDRLRNMIEDQKNYDDEREKDAAELLNELHRLQVYQPKLEMILETERAIKVELQNRIEKLEEKNDLLENELGEKMVKLSNEKSRAKMKDLVENEALQGELANWQDKYYRLKREKSDADEMARMAKNKVSILESKYQSEMDLVKESHSKETEELRNSLLNIEKERTNLELRLEGTVKKLNNALSEEQRLTVELNNLTRNLTGKESEEDLLRNELKKREELVDNLRKQIEESEMIKRNISDDYEKCKLQLDRINPQVEDLRVKLELQHKKYEEFKAEKEKEMSKLRINLNFEKYNKQVALKGIEKELRVSLKELEAMKYRFSRRLATQGEPDSDTLVTQRTNRAPINGLSKDSCGKDQRINCKAQLSYPKAKRISSPIRGDIS